MSSWAKRLFAVTRGSTFRTLLKLAIAVAVLVSIATALKGYRAPLEGRLAQLHFGWLLVGLGLSAVYRVVNAYGWVLVLRAIGKPLPGATGVRLWLISETMRWLPGSVWSFFSRVAQAKAAGINPVSASLSLPLELLLTIASWCVVAVAGVGISGTAGLWLSRLPAFWIVACVLGLGLSVGSVFALARWLPSSAISKKVRGLLESLRQLRASKPSFLLLAAIFGFYVLLGFFQGVAFLAVLKSCSDSQPGLLAIIGINAAGWLVGFFAFFAPAGLGVREGGMTAMLAPLMPVDAAIVGVLLWRVIQIIVEVLCLGACFVPTAVSTLRRIAGKGCAEG